MTGKLRAYHFDLKRAMWTRDYMDRMADRLKVWGFNAIVYEMEDKFRFSRHPAVAHADAFSPEETAAFASACRAKSLEVIPLMQSLGHAEFVVGRPEYAHLREAPEIADQYDPLSPAARAFLLELFDEIIEAFRPREFFHMGGDETWSLGRSATCAEVVREIGVGGLYLRHMLPLFEHLHAKGLRPIIWADIALSHPEIIRDIPRYVVMMDWEYGVTEERPRRARIWGADRATGALNRMVTWAEYADAASPAFREHLEPYAVDDRTRRDGTFPAFYCTDALRGMGFDVITAPANRCWGDMMGIPAHAMHLPNCFYFARKGMASGMGNLVTSWAVRHAHPEVCQYSTFAAAAAAQTGGAFDEEALGRAFMAALCGTRDTAFAGAVRQAQQGFGLAAQFGIQPARQKLRRGEDPLPALLEEYERHFGGPEKLREFLEERLSGYRQARAAFAATQQQARRNAAHLDFWIEGVDLHAFYAEFLAAAHAGALGARVPEFLARLEELRANTRRLFGLTYAPRSVEEELDQRYGFHEEYLRSAGAKPR